MDSSKRTTWIVVAVTCAGFLILDALVGASSVRNALRAFVFVLLLAAVVMTVGDKIIVAFRTASPPSQPKIAYHAIFARTKDGQLTDGYVIGLLRVGTKGYTPLPDAGTFEDYKQAQKKADELNAQTGLSTWQINRIVNRWS